MHHIEVDRAVYSSTYHFMTNIFTTATYNVITICIPFTKGVVRIGPHPDNPPTPWALCPVLLHYSNLLYTSTMYTSTWHMDHGGQKEHTLLTSSTTCKNLKKYLQGKGDTKRQTLRPRRGRSTFFAPPPAVLFFPRPFFFFWGVGRGLSAPEVQGGGADRVCGDTKPTSTSGTTETGSSSSGLSSFLGPLTPRMANKGVPIYVRQ